MSHTIAALRAPTPMWVYEHNYAELALLAPLCEDGDEVRCYRAGRSVLELVVAERFKYTTTVVVKHGVGSSGRLLRDLHMSVRLYHDAGLAEVLSYQGHRRLLAEYAYPNEKMLHKDEKRQVNRLLYELLAHCRACGYRPSESDLTRV